MSTPYVHLLIINKEKHDLTALGEALQELAVYEVTMAGSLSEGEQLVRAKRFDIVLVDVGLEQEALAQFLEQSPDPVLVAGHVEQIPLLTQTVQNSANDYLLLPANATLLQARLRPHLREKRRREQAQTAVRDLNEVEKLADDLRLTILPLGIALSAERDWERLVERFVVTAMDLCNADAGSFFMRTEDNKLRYAVMRTKSLGQAYGGTTGQAVPYADLPLYGEDGQPDLINVATYAAHEGSLSNIDDIYDKSTFDFSGTHRFDERNKYRTISCLTVPLRNKDVIGVLQLRNAMDPETGEVVPFGAYHELVAESVASQASVALINRQLRQREGSLLRYKRELQIGREIQAGFFPTALPQPPGWELTARFQPAREVAGDFYDAFAVPYGKIGLVIADVCDKGVVAALFMALLRSLLRAFTKQHYYLRAQYGEMAAGEGDGAGSRPFPPIDKHVLLDTVRLTNGYIGNNHANTHIFATLFFAILDPGSGEMLYVNCGHIPPVLQKADGTVKRLMPTGPAIGLLPDAQYAVQKAQLGPGDTLLAYTDGVTEARDPQRKLFGEKRLLPLVAEYARHSAVDLLDAIEAAVREYAGGASPGDDVAMLALKRIA
jgi:sigma-B regulation protein RsbU (phosphoserine phosphatase)